MFTLKPYQANALATLEHFFKRLRLVGVEQAWTDALAATGQEARPYDSSALGNVPAVCVRIPTGGGKTFLAAHAIPRIGKTFDTDAPVALWLVPSEAIRSQTLAALKEPRHPCRIALQQAFGDRIRVCALDELATVGRHEVGASAIIVVATIQSFNVKDKTSRNVYAFDESLAVHFQGLTPQQAEPLDKVTAADLGVQQFLTQADVGRVKASLGNFLALTRPVIVVDEAHNNRTDQAFRTLKNLRPTCVVELTATPAKGSNVVFSVGAQALQHEEMIKLPIVLMEHPDGWRTAIRDAVLTRNRLEHLAAKEPEYLRPVLLLQAEPKGGEATVDAVLEYLTSEDGERLDRKQIAVATGDQKELAGVDLGDPGCPIRYVVTVEALKEGWDCPSAYVLCSLQDARSAKDVEQLLGRVLRMPYARKRAVPELNKAYAHIVAQSFAQVASTLVDRLIQNMGFEAYEAVAAIAPPSGEQLELTPKIGEGSPVRTYLTLPSVPALEIPESLKESVRIIPTMAGNATVALDGPLTDEIAAFLIEGFKGKEKEAVRSTIEQEQLRRAATEAPGTLGVRFAPLPQLCIDFDGALQPVDKRLLSALGEFDLFAEPIGISNFEVYETGYVFEIRVEGGAIKYQVEASSQLELNIVASHWKTNDLVRWLDRECRQLDVAQPVMMNWLLKTVQYLQHDRQIPLTALTRARHQLRDAIDREIVRRRQAAMQKGFQLKLGTFQAAPALDDSFRYTFEFHPTNYPARPPFYRGAYKFKKHYYPVIHDLKEKTDAGELTEEFLCARAIDISPHVKLWIRNVERQERASFWLPTSSDLFYPDFVCELTDGRILVVEYKGEHLVSNDDTKEKWLIGEQWEKSSGGRCLFLLATKPKGAGAEILSQQIEAEIRGAN